MQMTVSELEGYLYSLYGSKDQATIELDLFMKLVEEMGEVAEVINKKEGRKPSTDEDLLPQLGYELADVVHFAIAVAAVNGLDMERFILEKDRKAAVKYHHAMDLEHFIAKQREGRAEG